MALRDREVAFEIVFLKIKSGFGVGKAKRAHHASNVRNSEWWHGASAPLPTLGTTMPRLTSAA
jgi:hypothetical protein